MGVVLRAAARGRHAGHGRAQEAGNCRRKPELERPSTVLPIPYEFAACGSYSTPLMSPAGRLSTPKFNSTLLPAGSRRKN
jgi:hypothetical protein